MPGDFLQLTHQLAMQQSHSPLAVAVSTVVFVVLVLLVVLVLVVLVLVVLVVIVLLVVALVVVRTMSDKATGVYTMNFSSLDPVTTRSRKKIPYHGLDDLPGAGLLNPVANDQALAKDLRTKQRRQNYVTESWMKIIEDYVFSIIQLYSFVHS